MATSGAWVRGLLAAGFLLFAYFLYDAGVPAMAAAAAGLAALLAWLAWRGARQPPSPPRAESPPTLQAALVTCGTLLAIDAAFFGAPMLGAYAFIALLVWVAPRILFAWRRPELRRHRAKVALVALSAILLDIGTFALYEHIAQQRVITVADALSRYKSVQGAYPKRLQDLVPSQLPALPHAKPLGLARIHYVNVEGAVSLMYVRFPPFGRRMLDVETREWSDLVD